MNTFDVLVDASLVNQPALANLRIVVEKELLHHDILRTMNQMQLLDNLTFIGGTCLRACYGSQRLSEDLDFTGGYAFTKSSLTDFSKVLRKTLLQKYNFHTEVTNPIKESNNVDTWKIKIITKPAQRNIPTQRINLDICSIPSYERSPMQLRNPYGIDMGTTNLIIQAQSKEEIYIDKLIAFGLRPNRIKYRDLWDISWLQRQNITPHYHLLKQKLKDHNTSFLHYIDSFSIRLDELHTTKIKQEYIKEMSRFLPNTLLPKDNIDDYIDCLKHIMVGHKKMLENHI